jgi:hypothetical protein
MILLILTPNHWLHGGAHGSAPPTPIWSHSGGSHHGRKNTCKGPSGFRNSQPVGIPSIDLGHEIPFAFSKSATPVSIPGVYTHFHLGEGILSDFV